MKLQVRKYNCRNEICRDWIKSYRWYFHIRRDLRHVPTPKGWHNLMKLRRFLVADSDFDLINKWKYYRSRILSGSGAFWHLQFPFGHWTKANMATLTFWSFCSSMSAMRPQNSIVITQHPYLFLGCPLSAYPPLRLQVQTSFTSRRFLERLMTN